MTTSLDITGKIDAATVELLRTVSRAIEALGIPYVVVGATARDLVLHHGYGADLERATQDIDFAIEVPDWAAFNALADTLVENGFKPTRAPHRLISPADTIIDIVPFGQVEDADASIAWPPEGKDVMMCSASRRPATTRCRCALQMSPSWWCWLRTRRVWHCSS